VGLLNVDPAEPTKAIASEHSRDGRERHRQRLGDLGGRHPQPPQSHDHRHPIRSRAISYPLGRR
jgi:hypothetical protein